MTAHSELHSVSVHLNGLQSRIETLIAEQLGFQRGPGMTLAQEMDAQDAACEAVERWAAAMEGNPDLTPRTPLQRLLNEYLEAHETYLDALAAAGIRL